ncbi:unnamed protein product [Cylicocyclus nassatus]|uniref:Transcriptional repressor p66 coiled-coil MBD2-interaction domain-containing protein n=1 Tax=Cylicocyclus nassatus TaxID=53992 RepID=A0AA36DWT6_CYLNA|nr:unnamed protein product [Cylicocyclus nassatus]
MTMAHVDNDQRPMSNGCENNHDTMVEPMDLSAPMPNGTPSKSTVEFADGQLSPASLRRRSTRASALKAQEKIKHKDDFLMAATVEKEEMEETGESSPKKRKLYDGSCFDQFSHKFGLREQNGNVYPLTDESEVSSLHDSEVITLKASYDRLVSKELTPEQRHERTLMIKQCEAELRLEEAKLTMLKKIKASQMLATQKLHEAKKATPHMSLNNAGGAYKPLVAPPLHKTASAPANGKSGSVGSSRPNPVLGLAGLTPQQQQELLRSAQANPAALQALLMQAAKSGQSPAQALAALFANHASTSSQAASLAQQLKEQRAKEEQLLKEQAAATQANNAAQQAKLLAAQTPQQRAATARQAFRMQADKQLMQQISAPKAPPIDLFFIPNGSQPDFCYLVGLDLVVQRVLKDKNVYRSVSEVPYECEECGTDFTPSWKAIGTSANDMHLYCEQCVRSAQKRKIRTDHSNVLKKAYNKINSQEKEFEKQIADGKLEAALAAAAQAHAAAAAAAAAASSSCASTSQAQNLSTKMPNLSASQQRSGTSTPTVRKAATPVPQSSTPLTKVGSSSSSNTPAMKKSNSSPGLSMAAMQQQMAAMQQLVRANPMMAMAASQMAGAAAAAGNPMASMMQQMWNPMMLQAAATQMRLQQQQAQHQANQPNMAMTMLAQAVQHAQSSGLTGQNNNPLAQLAAAAAMNPALMSNPQLLRQIQQMQSRGLIESLRGKK